MKTTSKLSAGTRIAIAKARSRYDKYNIGGQEKADAQRARPITLTRAQYEQNKKDGK